MESSDDENNDHLLGGEDSDNDPDYVVIQSDAESEQSADDETEEEPALPKIRRLSILKGKNGYKWSTDVPVWLRSVFPCTVHKFTIFGWFRIFFRIKKKCLVF